MPLCSGCREEAEVTVVGPSDPWWIEWLGSLFSVDEDEEPERCSRCGNCGRRA